MSTTVNGILVPKSQGASSNYSGHSIAVTLDYHEQLEETLALRQEQSIRVAVEANGSFALELPDRKHLVSGSIDVFAPDGQQLHSETHDAKELIKKAQQVKVDPATYFTVEPHPDPNRGKTARIRGNLIDLNGNRAGGKHRMVLWASEDNVKEFDTGKLSPVAITETDGAGHFFADLNGTRYKTAYWAIAGAVNQITKVNIKDGVLPERVNVAVDLTELEIDHEHGEDDSDCGCHSQDTVPRLPDNEDLLESSDTYTQDVGGGKCVDFTKPNRTLQEFNYYKVVRTTEPDIHGLNLNDNDPSTLNYDLLKTFLGSMGQPQKTSFTMSSVAKPEGGNDDITFNFMSTTGSAGGAGDAAAFGLTNDMLRRIATDPDYFTPENLMRDQRQQVFDRFAEYAQALQKSGPRRKYLTSRNPIDWDDHPTFYQAATIAHGHILHFKQKWKADGYSLGNLLYSLPLAPCQKKQIAILDWDRTEEAARTELLSSRESVEAFVDRDRSILDVIDASLDESVTGGSNSRTRGRSGGGGIGVGGTIKGFFLGASAGYSKSSGSSSSRAWQNSARDLSASSLNDLQDSIQQGASALRSQRSTVVQTVGQSETVTAQTEVVSNKNHCHAVTMEYFEVLRHYAIQQELADVQECLFIPLMLSRFDVQKTMRWRTILESELSKRSLRGGFEALERIRTNYAHSDLPEGIYAEETLDHLEGTLTMRFSLPRPKDDEEGRFLDENWEAYEELLGQVGLNLIDIRYIFHPDPVVAHLNDIEDQEELQRERERFQAELQRISRLRDEAYQRDVAPRIAEAFVQNLNFSLDTGDMEPVRIPMDATLVSDYRSGSLLTVTLHPAGSIPALARKDINRLYINATNVLLPDAKVIVHRVDMRYRTRHLNHSLIRNAYVRNDIRVGDGVTVSTPMSGVELRNPRKRDRELAQELQAHLNENLEYYHTRLWRRMDANRRYMLLDGFIAPNSGGKSVASVVENRVIGISGNCLIMPVARGYQLDPTYTIDEKNPAALIDRYAPVTPIPPYRIAVTTKGVYAEAVQGACNSCEKKDETRFWRFEESPCGDEPTPIGALSTDSRRTDPGNLQAKDFANPIVNIQNVPNAPDPQGLAGALQTLATSGVFNDITGLDQNQLNALQAMLSSQDSAKAFAQEAGSLARQAAMTQSIDRTLEKIRDAEAAGMLPPGEAQRLTAETFRTSLGSRPNQSGRSFMDSGVDIAREAQRRGNAEVTVTGDNGAVTVKPVADMAAADQDNDQGINVTTTNEILVDLRSLNSTDALAFHPRSNDKSGEIRLQAHMPDYQEGDSLTWSTNFGNAVILPDAENPLEATVLAAGSGVEFVTLRNNTRNSEDVIRISVPQFIVVREHPLFDQALQSLSVNSFKQDVLDGMKRIAESLIVYTTNARFIWEMAPFNEQVPEHMRAGGKAAGLYMSVDLKDQSVNDPKRPELAQRPNSPLYAITSYQNPGKGYIEAPIKPFEWTNMYCGEIARGHVTTGTNRYSFFLNRANKLWKDAATLVTAKKFQDPVVVLWKTAYARILGETLAHEITHGLLGGLINPKSKDPRYITHLPVASNGGVNVPVDTHALMNSGSMRTFYDRTGIEITDPSLWPTSGYTDKGESDINQHLPRLAKELKRLYPIDL